MLVMVFPPNGFRMKCQGFLLVESAQLKNTPKTPKEHVNVWPILGWVWTLQKKARTQLKTRGYLGSRHVCFLFLCHDSVILRRISPGLLLFRDRQVSQDAVRLGGSVPWLFSNGKMVSPRRRGEFKGMIGARFLRDVVFVWGAVVGGFTLEAAGSFFEVTHSEGREIRWTIKRQRCVWCVCYYLHHFWGRGCISRFISAD